MPTIHRRGDDSVSPVTHTGRRALALVAQALSDRDWVAQEYVESLPFCFLSGHEPRRYNAVWGFFGFGPRFAGALVRTRELGRDVINASASQGEVEVPLMFYSDE